MLEFNYYSGRVGGWVALEEWKLRLTSAKVEVDVEAELGNNTFYAIKILLEMTGIRQFKKQASCKMVMY